MRTLYWFFLVSVALFVGGIAFIVAGARSARDAGADEPAAAAATAVIPVATVRQIMIGIVAPTSTVIYDAVATTVTASGTEEKMPRTDEEWAVVAANAAALAESGNLMLMGNRAVDRGDWQTISQAMIAASQKAVAAADARSAEGILAAGEAINQTCDSCHAKYGRQ